MRKLQKVQATAAEDSRLGRRWERVVQNLLASRGITATERVSIAGFDHENDLVIQGTGDSPKCILTVTHVKQRNPKEKYYRLLDELALIRCAHPETRVVLFYAGGFLAEKGWSDVLKACYDAVIVLKQFPGANGVEGAATSGQPASAALLPRSEAKAWVERCGAEELASALATSINGAASALEIWKALRKRSASMRSQLASRRGTLIQTDGQTLIRRPLLAAVALPPTIRKRLAESPSGRVVLDKDEAVTQERLGTIAVTQSILGSSGSLASDVSALLRESPELVENFEAAVRAENPVYAGYLDDLHDPRRLSEMCAAFKEMVGKNAINGKRLARACASVRDGQVGLRYSRVGVWPLEVALVHAGISRNEADKRLAAATRRFPNARNVTGRYIYGTLKDSTRMSLTSYETAIGRLLDATPLLEDDAAAYGLVEDRRYALAVIQTPRPLDSLVSASIAGVPGAVSSGAVCEPTMVSALFEAATGRRAGRLGVVPFQYELRIAGRRVLLRVLSGFDDSNRNHKVKELAAKMTFLRMREVAESRQPAIFIAVLDGDWTPTDQEALIVAGYDYVCSIPRLSRILKAIRRLLADKETIRSKREARCKP